MIRKYGLLAGLAMAPLAAALAAPSAADVGDADSFGRPLKWIGSMQGASVLFANFCGGDPDCVTLNPAPATTSFSRSDVARVTLPGRSTNSLICQWVTPSINYDLSNGTGANADAQVRITPTVTIESAVLNDPSLTNPDTGLPFGGSFTIGLTGHYSMLRTLGPGERESQRVSFTRACIGGIVNRHSLINTYGLSAAQADAFFRGTVTVRLNLSGTVGLVDSASLLYGIRLIGD